jgi:hypothetical protein
MKALWFRVGKSLIVLLLFFVSFLFSSFTTEMPVVRSLRALSMAHLNVLNAFSLADSAARLDQLYDNLGLENLELSKEAFKKAVWGFLNLQLNGLVRNPDVLSIVDFSLPSTKKRLFVIDMLNGRLLYNTLVAHGRNSGQLMATRFSNRDNSLMSSLGFYLTGDPFFGHNGYSLRLEGIEKGWNDHAYQRAIVLHPADYVSEEHIQAWGFLGRSEGCPAIPEEMNEPIIDQIKGGSCLFLYAPNQRYLHRSELNCTARASYQGKGSPGEMPCGGMARQRKGEQRPSHGS